MLLKKFKPLVLSYSKYLASRYNMDAEDLISEGNLALLELKGKVDTEDIPRMVAFVKLRVIGAMKEYVASNYGPVSMQNNKFWGDGEATFKAPVFDDVVDTVNPEELLIQKEEAAMLDERLAKFMRGRNMIDKIVFLECIYVEEPKTIRDVAMKTGISKSKVGRIKKKLEDEWKEFING